jgi:hypothetical protein
VRFRDLSDQRQMLCQFYLPQNPAYLDDEPAPPTPFVSAALADRDLKGEGAVVVWRDPGAPIGLWVEPVASAP